MNNCIFCNIIDGYTKTDILYQNDKMIVLNDINPKAPIHKLIIPKKHINTFNDLENEDLLLLSELMFVAKKLALSNKINKSGYRIIINCNQHGGQLIYHLHIHLIGGKFLNEI